MLQEYLKSFGLTGQEAIIYETMLKNGEMTGYEVSKATGISRSYVYGALAAMVDKGAAYLIEGDSAKYVAVDMKHFCENTLHDLREKANYLITHAPERQAEITGYITISGTSHIHNKIHEMLAACEKRVYIMASAEIISEFEEQIRELLSRELKVVLMTENIDIPGARILTTKTDPSQIRLITDSAYVLTGTYAGTDHDTCLYSGQPNLVTVVKEALGNRITLIELGDKSI